MAVYQPICITKFLSILYDVFLYRYYCNLFYYKQGPELDDLKMQKMTYKCYKNDFKNVCFSLKVINRYCFDTI